MAAASPLPASRAASRDLRLLAEQAFSRAAGAPLIAGNEIELLIDARANFDAWLAAIRAARETILFENYIFADDDTGREFRAALVERAEAGVEVFVLRDWLGCTRESDLAFWQPLIDAGGTVRTYNPPRFTSPFGWLSRDHRKLLVVDATVGFVGGVCLSGAWLGNPEKNVPPWRDTAVAVKGPVLAELVNAFAESWGMYGAPLPDAARSIADRCLEVGQVDMRVIATVPNRAGLYRLDQLIAAMARRSLWLSDAYFIGVAPYVQAISAAARDGVDVRLLVPGTSDVPAVASISRSGYRALLDAGVRIFEWNGSMMHAKTAVADGRWARVGSSNLNLSSWIGNCELDIAVEDEAFARRMEAQYEKDLENATEIVLKTPPRRRRSRPETSTGAPRARVRGGSSGRAAAGALRIANSFGAAITNRRVLADSETTPLIGSAVFLVVFAVVAAFFPRVVAWPLALLALWLGLALTARYFAARRKLDD